MQGSAASAATGVPAIRSDGLVPVLREISRGGLAGLLVGVVVGGLGGRLVMRLAALLVPGADGLTTENGNAIGDITAEGTIALVLFGGLLAGVVAAVVWVVIRPWLPASTAGRALAATPVALAFGTPVLVQRINPDFLILGFHPGVVASLLVLVALTAPAMAVADAWLDRRLPRPASTLSPAGVAYLGLTALGLLIGTMLVISIAGERSIVMLATVVPTGLCTVAWWSDRQRGASAPSPGLRRIATTIIAVGTGVGLALVAPEVAGALDI